MISRSAVFTSDAGISVSRARLLVLIDASAHRPHAGEQRDAQLWTNPLTVMISKTAHAHVLF
jgi:hypothetical protein